MVAGDVTGIGIGPARGGCSGRARPPAPASADLFGVPIPKRCRAGMAVHASRQRRQGRTTRRPGAVPTRSSRARCAAPVTVRVPQQVGYDRRERPPGASARCDGDRVAPVLGPGRPIGAVDGAAWKGCSVDRAVGMGSSIGGAPPRAEVSIHTLRTRSYCGWSSRYRRCDQARGLT